MSIKSYSLTELTKLTEIEHLGHHISQGKTGVIAYCLDNFNLDPAPEDHIWIRHTPGPSRVDLIFDHDNKNRFSLGYIRHGDGNEVVFEKTGADCFTPVMFRVLMEDSSPSDGAVAEYNFETGETTSYARDIHSPFAAGWAALGDSIHKWSVAHINLRNQDIEETALKIERLKKPEDVTRLADIFRNGNVPGTEKTCERIADQLESIDSKKQLKSIADDYRNAVKTTPSALTARQLPKGLSSPMELEVKTRCTFENPNDHIESTLKRVGITHKMFGLFVEAMFEAIKMVPEDKAGTVLQITSAHAPMMGVLSGPKELTP